MDRRVFALCVPLMLGGTPSYCAAIGIAVAGGSFRIDNSPVSGNATLFDGNQLETGAASPELRLYGGVTMRLASNSRGTVFQDRLVLEQGLSEMQGAGAYRIEARGLRILAAGPGTAARVALSGERKVEAMVMAGSLRVTTADGTVVALMRPPMALEFEPQGVTGAQVPFEMSGCLEQREGHFLLRDPLTGVVEEARGDRLDREAGNMVDVTATVVPGAKAIEGALEVIQITRLRRISGACGVPAPAAKPATGQARPPAGKPVPTGQAQPPAAKPAAKAAPAPKGMSGTKKAVIAGVVIGGAGAGAAVYFFEFRQNNKQTVSP